MNHRYKTNPSVSTATTSRFSSQMELRKFAPFVFLLHLGVLSTAVKGIYTTVFVLRYSIIRNIFLTKIFKFFILENLIHFVQSLLIHICFLGKMFYFRLHLTQVLTVRSFEFFGMCFVYKFGEHITPFPVSPFFCN